MSTLTQVQHEIADMALAVSYRPVAALKPDPKNARQCWFLLRIDPSRDTSRRLRAWVKRVFWSSWLTLPRSFIQS